MIVRTEEQLVRDISRNLREAMAVRGMTQAEVAERAGIHALTVGQIANAKTVPKLSTLHRVATVLGMDAALLVLPRKGGAE